MILWSDSESGLQGDGLGVAGCYESRDWGRLSLVILKLATWIGDDDKGL